jgi:hypothetical protein
MDEGKNRVEDVKRLTIRLTSRSLWRGGPARSDRDVHRKNSNSIDSPQAYNCDLEQKKCRGGKIFPAL